MNLKQKIAATPITLWSRKNEKNQYEHNHIEDGHCEFAADRPAPKTEAHKNTWNKGQWVYEHAWLDSSAPPKVLHNKSPEKIMEHTEFKSKFSAIRPANMRIVSRIMKKEENHDLFDNQKLSHSISCAMCVEDNLIDTEFCAISGGGMDAPEDIPVGQIKAFFRQNSYFGSSEYVCIGFCQRTITR